MLQIANTILYDEADDTKITILACNSSPDDVMLYEEINAISKESQGQIKVVWAVSRERPKKPTSAKCKVVPYPWPHVFGRIGTELMTEHLVPPSDDTIVCLCGPPGFNKVAQEAFTKQGYDRVLTW